MKATFKSNNGTIYDNADLALCDDAMHADFQMFTQCGEMGMKYIWIIYDDDSNAITAPTWEVAIHGWIDKWRVTGDVTLVFDEVLNAWRSLQDMYGDDWQSVLIAFGYKDFNDLFDTQFYAYQIPYYEE